MLDTLVKYLPLVLAAVGAASVLVHALEPLIKWSGLGRVARALEVLQGLLGKLALNPGAKAPPKQ